MIFFTSINANYFAKALVLGESIKKHSPLSKFIVVLSDKRTKIVEDLLIKYSSIVDDCIEIHCLGLPINELDQWIFKHTVVELCTAVKAQSFITISQKYGDKKVVYLDPDTVVFNSMEPINQLLDKHPVLLTPHQVEPDITRQAIVDNEICSLKHGIYNIGFMAVNCNEQGLRFVNWWNSRLIEFCYDDIPNGLFTDQKWIDLAPAFFDFVYILRDKEYNVATWNLTHRDITKDNQGTLLVNGKPLRFYHFSGFDSGAQEIMLKKYSSNSILFDLRNWYIDQQAKYGQKELCKIECEYNHFTNGEIISKDQRVMYRLNNELQSTFNSPFNADNNSNTYFHYYFKKHQGSSINEISFKECLFFLIKKLIRKFTFST